MRNFALRGDAGNALITSNSGLRAAHSAQSLPPAHRFGCEYAAPLAWLYPPQQLLDFRHGAGCKPFVPEILLADVEHGEFGGKPSSKINCEPE